MKRFFQGLLLLVLFAVALLYIFDYDYILKGVRVSYFTGHNSAFISDYTYFENNTISTSDQGQPWDLHKDYNSVEATPRLENANERFGTVAFLIIKNDSIWFEKYYEDYGTTSKSNSFSMAKSITSALLGKAIMDGYIKSLDQPVSDFFPKFSEGLAAKLTVGDLSSMASGLNWDEHYKNPFSITARGYYDDDLAETILGLEVTTEPGTSFSYMSGNTQLLGMVIRKATGRSLSQYLSESFWQPLGVEHDALWQLDDDEHQLEKAFCCIASNARDFSRFGKLYKNQGKWKGEQLLDAEFVDRSTKSRFGDNGVYGYGFWLDTYKGKDIFYMRGILGQYVIVIPEDDLIITRLGHHRGQPVPGKVHWSDFYIYIDEAYKMIENAT
ncbi:serine hydrolase domain-containing protein [Sungkyunkwania multivorans]|uniref:Serine hydrolase domain-containing protein n=1 Tax=Sungkyunkwania multivorans TaxID=1173618 RepID=A0ABW3CZ27_9FLAO